MSLGWNSHKNLEKFSIWLSMNELWSSLDWLLKVLLDQCGRFLRNESLWVNSSVLNKNWSGSLDTINEDTTSFTNNSSSFSMFINLFFEIGVFFFTLFVKATNFRLKVGKFLLLLANNTNKDFFLGVELSFKFSFKLNSSGISFSNVLIKSSNISITCILEVSVLNIVFLLLCNVASLKFIKGAQKFVNRFISFKLEPNGVENSSTESWLGNSINCLDDILLRGSKSRTHKN